MARNGSGTYILPPSNPVVSGTVIESDWANDTMADLAAAITQSIAYDGQTVPINNLPMGGFHHNNVSDPVSRNQYATLGMTQDGRHQRVQITSGVDNLIGTLVGGATAYVAGALVTFFAPATNTGAMTLNYNGIGPRSLVSPAGLPLSAGNITAGSFIMAIYDGTQFKMLTNVVATVNVEALTLATTGQERPGGGAYTPITIATGTSINIPAGTAFIVPPDSDSPDDAIEVSWPNQAVTLSFLTTSFTTTIAVNNFGQIVQFAGRTIGANLRDCAILGVVEHITGVANKVVTKPTIFADDGYRGTDIASLLTNTVISGGKIVPNGVSLLQLDISAGAIFMPGGDANTIKSPNVYPIPQQANIQFRTLAGQNTLGAVVSNAPVTQYDPNGAGVVTTIPNNNDTVVHRLYFLYGSYIWVLGQKIYASVEEAMSYLEWDRSQYKPSLFLMDATLLAEVIAIKNTTNLSTLAQCRVVSPGGLNFSIGSPGGISEAPINGTPYGRQDAAWVSVLRVTGPTAIDFMNVLGTPSAQFNVIQGDNLPGTVTTNHKSGNFNWFSIETSNPDDKTYFRSYNRTNGALRFTTTYDLATGVWNFPAVPTVGGTNAGVVSHPPGAVLDNALPRFNGTTGTSIKGSPVTLSDAGGLSKVESLNEGQFAGLRNRLINGSFNFWQRGTGPFTVDGYFADRWQAAFQTVGATFVAERNVGATFASPNPDLISWCHITANTVGGQPAFIRQPIEGVNTLANQTVTASAWIFNSDPSVTKNFQFRLVQFFGSGGSTPVESFSGALPCPAGVWTRVSATIALPSVAGKTINADNWLGFDLQFTSPNTGYNILITGAQIEKGSVATPFELLPIGFELILCQRYYESGTVSFTGYQLAGNGWGQEYTFKVAKRVPPLLLFTPTFNANALNPTISGASINGFGNAATVSVTGSAINAGNWIASAEF